MNKKSNKPKYAAEYYGKVVASFFKKLSITIGVLLIIAAAIACLRYLPSIVSWVINFVNRTDAPYYVKLMVSWFPITIMVLVGIFKLICSFVWRIIKSIQSCKRYVNEKEVLEDHDS